MYWLTDFPEAEWSMPDFYLLIYFSRVAQKEFKRAMVLSWKTHRDLEN
jgi:hypothetical protein